VLDLGLPANMKAFPYRGEDISMQMTDAYINRQPPLTTYDYRIFFGIPDWYESCS
jgi:hypothetical protein